MKPFRKGLVAGKFSPLHLGHEALIEYALLQCEQVIILSYSNPEFPKCGRSERERWLKGRFPQLEVVVLDQAKVNELALRANIEPKRIPLNDGDRAAHRDFVAWALLYLCGTTVDSVFTSEDYGDRFAAHIEKYFSDYLAKAPKVKHVCYDKERRHFPHSGTSIREDYVAAQKQVSSSVFASLMPRVGIIGGSGSGKTALTKALAADLDTGWLSDYLGDEIQRLGGDVRYEDLIRIAKTQVKSELVLARRFGNRVLICDTTPLCIIQYAYRTFWEAHNDLKVLSQRSYDHLIVCDVLPTDDPNELNRRRTQHAWYQTTLNYAKIPFVVVSGTIEERVAQARKYIGL